MRLLGIFIIFLPCVVNSANILVLETIASPSHHIWIRTLTTALAEKGHNVTSLSADIEKETPENLHYLHLDKLYEVFYNTQDEDFVKEWDFLGMGKLNPYLQVIIFLDFPVLTAKGCLKSTGFQQLLDYPDDFKFDLIIYDFLADAVLLPFAQKFNDPPIIALTAFYAAEYTVPVVGGTFSPSFVPNIIGAADLDTFFSRLNNFIISHLDYFLRQYYVMPKVNKLIRKELPWAKDVRELNQLERNSFRKLIEEMLQNPKYRENARMRSEIFRDQKETPLERAVWWTEFVLRHPNMTFMKSPSLQLGLAARQSWDVLAFLFILILIGAFISMKTICCCYWIFCKKSRKAKKE